MDIKIVSFFNFPDEVYARSFENASFNIKTSSCGTVPIQVLTDPGNVKQELNERPLGGMLSAY